jgi:hypothetical protein
MAICSSFYAASLLVTVLASATDPRIGIVGHLAFILRIPPLLVCIVGDAAKPTERLRPISVKKSLGLAASIGICTQLSSTISMIAFGRFYRARLEGDSTFFDLLEILDYGIQLAIIFAVYASLQII